MGSESAKPKTKEQRPRRTNRIPSFGGVESFDVAAWIIAASDVMEAVQVQAGIVQSVVEKAERGLVVFDLKVIKQRDDSRCGLYIGAQSGARDWPDYGGE